MGEIRQNFEERLGEIDAYIEFLNSIEHRVQDGPSKFGSAGSIAISPIQQRILYSSVYLQLYNLIEATVFLCLDGVTSAITASEIRPSRLTDKLLREWVQYMARPNVPLSPEKRLESALKLCRHLIDVLPIREFLLDSGGGGNWDDEAIQKVAKRIGLSWSLTRQANRSAKAPFRDDLGALAYVRALRNKLAHGRISFAECGEGVLVGDLVDLRDRTVRYLEEVVGTFEAFIEAEGFLLPGGQIQGMKA